MIATAVLFVITLLCAIGTLILTVLIRISLLHFSADKEFQLYDGHSKLCGVLAGVIFALLFTHFVSGVHKDCQDKHNSE